MKNCSHRHRPESGWLVAVLMALLFTGCATRKIDWASRVGSYTFDQAVVETGPPDKQARLADGTLVAEWLIRHGYAQSYPALPYYGYRPWDCYGPVFPTYINSYSPDYFLRLTFDPQGRLKAWKKFSR